MLTELDILQSQPAYGNAFFGREELLALLTKRVQAIKNGYRQNIAILGPKLIGKTSAIAHLLHTLEDKDIVPICIEVKEESLELFTKKYITSLLYHYLKSETEPVDPTNIEFSKLIERCSKSVPKTTQAIQKILITSKRNSSGILNQLIELPNIFCEEAQKCCLVILDEFHNLEKIGHENIFAILSKAIIIQKKIFYLLTSSKVNLAHKILAGKLHLLFGNFETVELGGFGIESSKSYLRRRFGDFRLPDHLLNFLAIFTDGNPFYLDIITTELLGRAKTRHLENIDEDTFTEVFEYLFLSHKGILNTYYTTVMAQLPQLKKINLQELTLVVASGLRKANEIAKKLGRNQQDTIRQLTALADLGLVEKCGVFYMIPDKVFKLWLCMVHAKRRSALLKNVEAEAQIFRNEFKNYVSNFISKVTPSEHVAELLRSFNNESAQIGHKTYRLRHFSRIETKSLAEKEEYVLAYGTKYWMCKIIRSEANENDVASFVTKCKASRREISKKVLFLFAGINECAKLMAKQEKILTIDLETLNLLSGLYDKPFFIV
ncbi:MAG: ATP-binding protein [Candidatus Omnitrophota bacterium]